MLAVVVTTQVQLLVPEFTVIHLLPVGILFYTLSHYVDSEKLSGRNQSIGCALVWVPIARDSESNYPFYPVGQFAGFMQVVNFLPSSRGEIMWPLFFESLYSFY